MDRRKAIKNIGTGIGAITLTPSMINLFKAVNHQTRMNLLTFSKTI